MSGGRGFAPDRVLADKASTTAANRAYLPRRGIRATIPINVDQAAVRRRNGSPGRPATDRRPDPHKQRHIVECGISNWAVAGRYDQLAVRYLAIIRITATKNGCPNADEARAKDRRHRGD